mmetsp:Transcript_7381/g.16736  ORF Transcript_7381/g.16736 Transcript_7381/m.16736 type:complete len:446 (+) Transcript_7381:113-1450(+)|eukprot:CAMPEP_0172306500 /NCGR_PEP_ID=MMETSP1058-20130122/7553_1 /TAXON_ID=83371 /ORGANISM="Detonula confervacea, Strain CCMP 353" /LENGTH=445 /DNA_ID=CAMNT_0013018397 /DNA_START=93 /DNA_END=1430 /DNA_ORIENTATION=-
MSSKNFDFLLEIMKVRTCTRQTQPDDSAPPLSASFCCGSQNVSDCDAEVRDHAPKSSQPRQSTTSSPPRNSSSNGHRAVYYFDYYGNPVGRPRQRSIDQPTQPVPSQSVNFARQATRDDYSEFLELNPIPTPTTKVQQRDVDVEQGCVAEFGQCLKVSLCCAADESMVENSFADDNNEGNMTQEAMMKEISDELQALRKSTREANMSKAVLQSELRAELASVQRQKIDMEESYRREIAREASEKLFLQAKLQQRLLSMMEERMMAEIQLGQLDCFKHVSGSSSQMKDLIPAAMCTPLNQHHEKDSPLSVGGASVILGPIDPPMHRSRMPVEPLAGSVLSVSTMLTSTPKTKALRTTPFGLSIVVENAASGGFEPDSSDGSGTGLASPTMNRSPPSSPCDPEGSFGDIGSPKANRSRSPSHITVPLPVATPVGHCPAVNRRFEVPE